MPNPMSFILFATSSFFDSQFALLLLTLLALATFSFALLISYGVITQRDASDAREIAALPDVIATLGDSFGEEPLAHMETPPAENAATTRSGPNLGEWSA